MPTVEVCFSPALYPFIAKINPTVTVVIDILRATTSLCTAFDYGVKEIIPLESIESAISFKEKNELVAAERDGLKPDFADFSNSAFDFMVPSINGKSIYYTTTNGTKAITLASSSGQVAIASFLNVPAICDWLIECNQDVILLCAGWKNNYSLEDTLCAGAIAQTLLQKKQFQSSGDSTLTSILLWESCNRDPEPLIRESSHFKRLEKLGFDNVLKYSLQIGKSTSVPILKGDRLINIKNSLNNKSV